MLTASIGTNSNLRDQPLAQLRDQHMLRNQSQNGSMVIQERNVHSSASLVYQNKQALRSVLGQKKGSVQEEINLPLGAQGVNPKLK